MQWTPILAVVGGRGWDPAAVGGHPVVADVDRVRDGRVGVDPTPGFGRRQVVAGRRADGRRRRVSLGSFGPVRRRVDPGLVPDWPR